MTLIVYGHLHDLYGHLISWPLSCSLHVMRGFCIHVTQALLTARQEKEIQLKMLLTRGESVQRNTSAEGVHLVRQQIEDLKDSWDGLLSASIQCKRLMWSY